MALQINNAPYLRHLSTKLAAATIAPPETRFIDLKSVKVPQRAAELDRMNGWQMRRDHSTLTAVDCSAFINHFCPSAGAAEWKSHFGFHYGRTKADRSISVFILHFLHFSITLTRAADELIWIFAFRIRLLALGDYCCVRDARRRGWETKGDAIVWRKKRARWKVVRARAEKTKIEMVERIKRQRWATKRGLGQRRNKSERQKADFYSRGATGRTLYANYSMMKWMVLENIIWYCLLNGWMKYPEFTEFQSPFPGLEKRRGKKSPTQQQLAENAPFSLRPNRLQNRTFPFAELFHCSSRAR